MEESVNQRATGAVLERGLQWRWQRDMLPFLCAQSREEGKSACQTSLSGVRAPGPEFHVLIHPEIPCAAVCDPVGDS